MCIPRSSSRMFRGSRWINMHEKEKRRSCPKNLPPDGQMMWMMGVEKKRQRTLLVSSAGIVAVGTRVVPSPRVLSASSFRVVPAEACSSDVCYPRLLQNLRSLLLDSFIPLISLQSLHESPPDDDGIHSCYSLLHTVLSTRVTSVIYISTLDTLLHNY